MTRAETQPYDRLTPDVVLQAVERAGYPTDGRVLALNSYENRVYQVGVEDGTPVVVKFYRPGRWSRDAVLEEHAFSLELAAAEIPVVAPIQRDGTTLFEHEGYAYAVFPRRGGRWPDLDTHDDRMWMGRFIGRIHRIGSTRRFEHRPRLSVEAMGEASAQYVLDGEWLPEYLVDRYSAVVDEALQQIRDAFDASGPLRTFRIHGDCHRGNILDRLRTCLVGLVCHVNRVLGVPPRRLIAEHRIALPP
jgi:Ser/Thr protein kinase RdoA (MazF antagonist)